MVVGIVTHALIGMKDELIKAASLHEWKYIKPED